MRYIEYSPGQVADMLGVSAATLRRYAATFKKRLSSSANRSRRKYTDQDLIILGKVRDGYAQGLSQSEIDAMVTVLEVPQEEQTQSSLAMIPAVAAEIEAAQSVARQALSLVEDMRSQLDQSQEDYKDLSARFDRLEEWINLPWWKKLFTPRN